MSRPNWKKSNLYQEILRCFKERGAPLTDRERRILREQLMAVATETDGRGALRHKGFCHNKPLLEAFTWDNTSQGDAYWREIFYAIIRPYVIR